MSTMNATRGTLNKLAFLLLAAAHVATAAPPPGWETVVEERLPFYGHRNWIVIADSAYPAQARDGIETIVADAGEGRVLSQVLALLNASKHVRPIVYTDSELNFVPESDANGISAFRRNLQTILAGQSMNSLPHEQIIAKLDQAAQTFRVLIIKTKMTLPYTSVFLQLDCAYWGPESEQKLRQAMASGTAQ
jgi:hypothetical protein